MCQDNDDWDDDRRLGGQTIGTDDDWDDEDD